MSSRAPRFAATVLCLAALGGCGGRVAPDVANDSGTAPTDASVDTRPSPPIDSGAFDTGPLPDGPSDTGTPTCSSCVLEHCRPEYEACVAQPECNAGVDCIDVCPVGAGRTDCLNGCITRAETPTAPRIDDLVNCIVTHCADVCDLH